MSVARTAIVVPAAGNTELINANVQEEEVFAFQIENTGANAFDACSIFGKIQPGAAEFLIASIAGDFTTPGTFVLKASGSLVTLAGGATGWVLLDVRMLSHVRITASAAAGGTTANIFGGG